MEGMRRHMSHLVVAALEFGTTYTGHAFSFLHQLKRDPLSIGMQCIPLITQSRAWCDGSIKTSTCLLLDKEKKFVAFGHDAEYRYTEMVMDEEQDNYYFFDRFTMNLHNNENVTRDMVLKDKTGKQCFAVEVFTLSIKALVDNLMERICTWITNDEILWVLTVPAAWTDTAKQLMRESAEKAGLHAENVLLITEPEAAFIYCHYIPTERLQDGIIIKDLGIKSMVVDLGDMTADITVLQQTYNGKLKELFRTTRDDCGGASVDDRFFKVLEEIVEGNVISAFKEKYTFDWLDLLQGVRIAKKGFMTKHTDAIGFDIPHSLTDICKDLHGKDLQSAIDSSSYVNKITLRGRILRVNADLMINFFTPAIDSIITLMKNTVSNKSTNGVSNILMVGGFSECPMVREAVQKAFPDNQIIIHDCPDLSVLKGAILFGYRPDCIRSVKGDSLDGDDDDDDDGCIGK